MSRTQKCSEVINDYEGYVALKEVEKHIKGGNIRLKKTNSNVHFQAAKMSTEDDIFTVEIKQKIDAERHYSINLYCPTFMACRPCFRFDSDGHVHMNRNGKPLLQRRIPTPHFHEFDEQGREIAYRTERIDGDKTFPTGKSDALNHFSEVHNMVMESELKIVSEGDLFRDETEGFDPNSGEDFNE